MGRERSLGARYGKKIRDRFKEKSPKDAKCPECSKKSLQRTAAGVWECKSCGHKEAGGAYKPNTGAEKLLEKALFKNTEE